ncbi:hypothetical protein P4B35_07585 [Pontiellaceae bacterium B12227]|nr:hypothetical protein [Pontiellaceae bacterium B12227]
MSLCLLAVGAVQAATIHWNGGGADDNWNTALNWDGNVLPGSSVSDNALLTAGSCLSVAYYRSNPASPG